MKSYLLVLIFISFIFQLGSVEKSKKTNYENKSKIKVHENVHSVDVEYKDYSNKADSVLSNYNTNLTGEIFAESWSKTKEQYGIDVPLSLALAQAKMESRFCTSKLSIQKNNPFSLKGKKSYKTFETLSSGVEAYYKLMATRYLNCRNLQQLLKNFVNCSGHRYAGSPNYEYSLKKEIKIIEEKIK